MFVTTRILVCVCVFCLSAEKSNKNLNTVARPLVPKDWFNLTNTASLLPQIFSLPGPVGLFLYRPAVQRYPL